MGEGLRSAPTLQSLIFRHLCHRRSGAVSAPGWETVGGRGAGCDATRNLCRERDREEGTASTEAETLQIFRQKKPCSHWTGGGSGQRFWSASFRPTGLVCLGVYPSHVHS